jgi:hypothetical protein
MHTGDRRKLRGRLELSDLQIVPTPPTRPYGCEVDLPVTEHPDSAHAVASDFFGPLDSFSTQNDPGTLHAFNSNPPGSLQLPG